MDPLLLALAVCVGLALGYGGGRLRAQLQRDEILEALQELPANDAGLPAPARPRPPDHVHTYALTSREETGGFQVAIYRCAECGDVERWVAGLGDA